VQLQEILSAHALSDMLDFVGTLDPSAEKPAKGFLEEALAGSGLRKDGIVHIVDVFSADYPGRKAMGVDSIVLDRYLADLAGGQAVTIRSLKELTYLIRHPSV
jgi:FMN phosphatase YigB (HAD superfamily)